MSFHVDESQLLTLLQVAASILLFKGGVGDTAVD